LACPRPGRLRGLRAPPGGRLVKILFLSVSAATGGAERLLLDALALLRPAKPALGMHPALAQDGPPATAARELGVAVHDLPMPPRLLRTGDSSLSGRPRWQRALGAAQQGLTAGFSAWRYARRLRALVGELRPDVVHSNGLKFHLLATL